VLILFIIAAIIVNINVSNIELLVAVSATLLTGSVLPDIDHPFSRVRRTFRIVIFLIIFIMICLLLMTQESSKIFSELCRQYRCSDFVLIVQILSALVSSFVIVVIIDSFIPFHRGPLHGFFAAVGYGLVCGLLTASLNYVDYTLVAVAGSIGYLSHILCDAIYSHRK